MYRLASDYVHGRPDPACGGQPLCTAYGLASNYLHGKPDSRLYVQCTWQLFARQARLAPICSVYLAIICMAGQTVPVAARHNVKSTWSAIICTAGHWRPVTMLRVPGQRLFARQAIGGQPQCLEYLVSDYLHGRPLAASLNV